MSPAELTAYRDLCREWPECKPADVEIWKECVVWWVDKGCGLRGGSMHAYIIRHLESLLDKHAPGWSLHSGNDGKEMPTYEMPKLPDQYWRSAPSRLSALLAAVRAVMTAKEPRQ